VKSIMAAWRHDAVTPAMAQRKKMACSKTLSLLIEIKWRRVSIMAQA